MGSSLSRESSATPPDTIIPPSLTMHSTTASSNQGPPASRPKQTMAMTTYINQQPTPSSPAPKQAVAQQAQANNISMQLPTGGIATLLPPASAYTTYHSVLYCDKPCSSVWIYV